MSKVAFRS